MLSANIMPMSYYLFSQIVIIVGCFLIIIIVGCFSDCYYWEYCHLLNNILFSLSIAFCVQLSGWKVQFSTC